MSHEDRMKLILKPFPDVRIIPSAARYYGIYNYRQDGSLVSAIVRQGADHQGGTATWLLSGDTFQ